MPERKSASHFGPDPDASLHETEAQTAPEEEPQTPTPPEGFEPVTGREDGSGGIVFDPPQEPKTPEPAAVEEAEPAAPVDTDAEGMEERPEPAETVAEVMEEQPEPVEPQQAFEEAEDRPPPAAPRAQRVAAPKPPPSPSMPDADAAGGSKKRRLWGNLRDAIRLGREHKRQRRRDRFEQRYGAEPSGSGSGASVDELKRMIEAVDRKHTDHAQQIARFLQQLPAMIRQELEAGGEADD